MEKSIKIVGFPYDEKSSFMRGPAEAPEYIRECLNSGSSNYYAENGVSIEDERISDNGDAVIKEYFDIENVAREILASGSRLLSLGGDHSVTFPIIKAYADFYDNFEILHIDAHADLYDELDGDKYSHACPFARIMENAYAARLVQLGIRTLNPHQREQGRKFAVEMVEMKNFNINMLPQFSRPLYISIDLDGIDPAFAPGVSHHEPGGLTSRDVITIIQSLDVPVIGADIVELNPVRDISGITAALAAKLAKEILAAMLCEKI